MSAWIQTPLGAVGAGLAAAVIGTLAMTAYQYAAIGIQKLRSPQPADASGEDSWDEAPAPAQVGYRLVSGLTRHKPPPSQIGLYTQAMHFGYGTMWGAFFGIVQGTADVPAVPAGLVFGVVVWLIGYATLVPIGIYDKPFWRYPIGPTLLEFSQHLLYGLVTAVAFCAIGEI